jgi:hypothetical protein
MGEIIFHLFIACGLGAFYVESTNINTTRVVDIIGAAGFPKAIILLALALTLISLYITFKKYMKNSMEDSKQLEGEINIQFIGMLISVVLFILSTSFIGFILAAILLMVGIMFILGQKSIKKVALIAVITSLLFTVVFGRLLHVPLPRGISLIKELSFLIY